MTFKFVPSRSFGGNSFHGGSFSRRCTVYIGGGPEHFRPRPSCIDPDQRAPAGRFNPAIHRTRALTLDQIRTVVNYYSLTLDQFSINAIVLDYLQRYFRIFIRGEISLKGNITLKIHSKLIILFPIFKA